jgi:hypothetical protein
MYVTTKQSIGVWADEIEDTYTFDYMYAGDYAKNVCTSLVFLFFSLLLFSYILILFRSTKKTKKSSFVSFFLSYHLSLAPFLFCCSQGHLEMNVLEHTHIHVPISFRRLYSLIKLAIDIRFEIASFKCI